MNVDFAQSHADGATLQQAVDDMTWYGETTAVACALDEGANQMNTGDNINDVMIGETLRSIFRLLTLLISSYRWLG